MYARMKTLINNDGSIKDIHTNNRPVWENDKVRQKVLLNLGRIKNLQECALDRLIALNIPRKGILIRDSENFHYLLLEELTTMPAAY